MVLLHRAAGVNYYYDRFCISWKFVFYQLVHIASNLLFLDEDKFSNQLLIVIY